MERTTIKVFRFGIWGSLASVIAIGFAIAVAAPASAQTAIQACINNKTHAPRLIPTGKACKKTETLDTLGATGPQGPPGPQGQQGVPGAPGSSNAWSFTGNSGKDPANNFLGTTDNQPFEIHVNALRTMRYEPAAPDDNNNFGPNLLGGDASNTITGGIQGATIGGGGGTTSGFPNAQSIQADFGTIGGGFGNLVKGGGGQSNAGLASTIAGGSLNIVGAPTGPGLTGVLDGTLPGQAATVGGGLKNQALGVVATVAGGFENHATGNAATVPGGFGNLATGDFSFAAGSNTAATHSGSFVWSDTSGQVGNLTLGDTAANQFIARATGGVFFITAQNPNHLCQIDTGANITCNGVFTSTSDRNAKDGFKPVAASDVLKGVAALPMTSWTFKGDKVRHIGPMAQDFYSAFKVGADDKHISTTDAQGVALAAIQGLYQELQAKDAELAQQKEQLAEQGRQIKSLMAQRDAERAEQNTQAAALNARLEKLERETETARAAASMHPASAIDAPRPASVNSF